MKKILDVCCGGKMFYFDKEDERVLFCDKRSESHVLCDGRSFVVDPDMECDFTDLPFEDESFPLIVFDPPHLTSIGKSSWMAKKYGKLDGSWPEMLKKGFDECWRVLAKDGTLVFKWNETDIKTKQIIDIFGVRPIFGHMSGKRSNTHWMCFFKSV